MRTNFLMKQWNVYRPHYCAPSSLAIIMASALMICPAYASEPEPDTSEWQPETMGLNKEQAQTVAKAREEQAKMGYSKQEEAAIDLAISKVNERAPVSREALTNLRIRSIQWPDSSLGCAESGVEYLQKVVQGYLVNFKVDEKFYTVNVGDSRAVVCDRIKDFMLERKQRADSVISAHRTARLDLAEKLMVDPELVKMSKINFATYSYIFIRQNINKTFN